MAIKKNPTTIRDIAKLANVSYQTVSLVMNNKPGVSDKTRKRILRLMEELDYRPNHAAQMLSTHRSNTLEMIMIDVIYGGRMADSTKNMVRAARDAGYSLLVSEADSQNLQAAIDNSTSRMVDGIILYAPRLRMTDEELIKISNGIPMVRRDYLPGSKLAWVAFDQVYATRLAVEHLIGLGHRQIAFIPPEPDIINGYWRYAAWKTVLLEHGLEPGPSFPGDYSIRSGYEAAQKILATGQPFTALMGGTDYMTVGAMRALRESGLRVPEDVSVVGFDNAELSPYVEPPLTTIAFKFHKQDELAVKYLIDLIAQPQMDLHQIVMMSELVVRASTCAAAS